MQEQTVKCRICGAPYKFYAFSAADQSACPSCVREAERNMRDVRPRDPRNDRVDLSRSTLESLLRPKSPGPLRCRWKPEQGGDIIA